MSRLIDANELLKEFDPDGERLDPIFVRSRIVQQPTAFDTEKVVEHLEKEGQKMAEAKPTKPYGKSSSSCHRYYKAISVKKAIYIVKKGGVE